MKTLIVTITILTLWVIKVDAQVTLVKDINSGTGSSNPSWITNVNGALFFYANDGVHGRELWKHDGGAATSLIADLNTGSDSIIKTSYYGSLASVGSNVYFPAFLPTTGTELYKYDGVNAPAIAFELEAGSASSSPSYLIALNNKVYFSATTTAHGNELWEFDPTTKSAKRLSDISPGPLTSNVKYLTVLNGKIYFSAGDTVSGIELYVYDPGSNNVTLVADIRAGKQSSQPYDLIAYNNRLYFSADDNIYGRELYEYDGISAPVRVSDINTSGSSLRNTRYINFYGYKNEVYFTATNASGGYKYNLYKYNPATKNVTFVFEPKNPTLVGFNATGFTAFNNQLYFKGEDAVHGEELWKYNGVDTPTMVADIYAGTKSSIPFELTVLGNRLFFHAGNANNGRELFSIDSATNIKMTTLNDYSIQIYPNPASNVINVEYKTTLGENVQATLCDINGRVLHSAYIESSKHGKRSSIAIPTIDIDPGIYIVAIRIDGVLSKSQTIIKK